MNILTVCPNILDATSYYRAAGPLSFMERLNQIEPTIYADRVGWPQMASTSCLFLQRPAIPAAADIGRMAVSMNIPIWVDWDDDPTAIPISNGAFETYAKPATREAVMSCLKMASVVTVSTPALAETMKRLSQNVLVIPNAIDPRFTPLPAIRPQTNKAVIWRGSNTHSEDLASVEAEYRQAILDNPDTLFGFFGHMPSRIICQSETGTLPNVRVRGLSDIFVFFKALRSFAAGIAVFPLVDSPFNRAKSNIAWLETHTAGAVMLAPALPEFVRPGIVNYSDAADFKTKLTGLIAGEFDTDSLWKQAQEYIIENNSLYQTAGARYGMLSDLLRPK